MRRIAVLSDQTKIAIVSAVCLMALAVVLKNVLHVPAAELSRDMIIFIIIYSGFWLLPSISARREKRSRFETPLFWCLMALAVTAGIIVVYAV